MYLASEGTRQNAFQVCTARVSTTTRCCVSTRPVGVVANPFAFFYSGFLKAVEACRRQLSQADQAYLNSVESEEDLTRKLRSEIDKYEEYQSLRSKLNLILETMFNFVVVIGALLNFSLKQLAVLWGLLSLVLYVRYLSPIYIHKWDWSNVV